MHTVKHTVTNALVRIRPVRKFILWYSPQPRIMQRDVGNGIAAAAGIIITAGYVLVVNVTGPRLVIDCAVIGVQALLVASYVWTWRKRRAVWEDTPGHIRYLYLVGDKLGGGR